jgi:hypothetical protein
VKFEFNRCATEEEVASPSTSTKAAAGDLNADGRLDLVVVSYAGPSPVSEVRVFLNTCD